MKYKRFYWYTRLLSVSSKAMYRLVYLCFNTGQSAVQNSKGFACLSSRYSNNAKVHYNELKILFAFDNHKFGPTASTPSHY